MASVINQDLALWLARNGYFYVMHRFNPENRLNFIQTMHENGCFASISIGIKPAEQEFIKQLVEENQKPEYITIDVAHGHSDYVIEMINM